MQGNKAKDTKPELVLRKKLCQTGIKGYRLHWRVPGKPDIAWPGKKVAIFVNGCFWHRCPYCKLSTPKSNVEYWIAKFNRNVQRDAENIKALENEGWKVHTIWECRLSKKNIDATMDIFLPILSAELAGESEEN